MLDDWIISAANDRGRSQIVVDYASGRWSVNNLSDLPRVAERIRKNAASAEMLLAPTRDPLCAVAAIVAAMQLARPVAFIEGVTGGERTWRVQEKIPAAWVRSDGDVSILPCDLFGSVPEGFALLLRSSGTSATAKCVVHGAESVEQALIAMGGDLGGAMAGWTGLLVQPAGSTGLLYSLLRNVICGMSSVLMPLSTHPRVLEQAVATASSPFSLGIPPAYAVAVLRAARCPDLRRLSSGTYFGGAAAAGSLASAWIQATGTSAYVTYGSTECFGPISIGAFPEDPGDRRPGYAGALLRGLTVVSAPQSGELVFSGARVARAYLQDGEERPLSSRPSSWCSGDEGAVVENDLYCYGRVDSRVSRNGVAAIPDPFELELSWRIGCDVVLLNLTATDVVTAVVESRTAPSLSELQRHLRSIPGAHTVQPESVVSIDSFPRTSTGKVRRSALRRALSATQR